MFVERVVMYYHLDFALLMNECPPPGGHSTETSPGLYRVMCSIPWLARCMASPAPQLAELALQLTYAARPPRGLARSSLACSIGMALA